MIEQYEMGPLATNGETSRQFNGPVSAIRITPVLTGAVTPTLAGRFPSIRFDNQKPQVIVGPELRRSPKGRAWDTLIVSVPAGLALVEIADTDRDAEELKAAIQGVQGPELLAGVGGYSAGLAGRVATRSELIFKSTVAAGAAIDTGVLDVSRISRVTLLMYNAGAGARPVTCDRYDLDGVTPVYAAQALAAGSVGTSLATQGDGITVAGIGGLTLDTASLSPKMRWQVAAGGVGSFSLTIWGR